MECLRSFCVFFWLRLELLPQKSICYRRWKRKSSLQTIGKILNLSLLIYDRKMNLIVGISKVQNLFIITQQILKGSFLNLIEIQKFFFIARKAGKALSQGGIWKN